MTDTQTAIQRLKALESAIQKAEVEVGVRQKQLNELKPRRKQYEAKSLSSYGVPINELEDYCNGLEEEAEKLIASLELKLEKAGNDSP